MDKKELVKKWLEYKTFVIENETDYSENDMFIEDNNVSDEDFEYLLTLPIKVVLKGNIK